MQARNSDNSFTLFLSFAMNLKIANEMAWRTMNRPNLANNQTSSWSVVPQRISICNTGMNGELAVKLWSTVDQVL